MSGYNNAPVRPARNRKPPDLFAVPTQWQMGFEHGSAVEIAAHAAAALVASCDSATACCCSASLLSQRPAHSAHRPGPEAVPGTWQLWSGPETAAQTCQRAACRLPAATARQAAGALSRCQRPATSARALWLQLAPRPVCSACVMFGDVPGC